MRLLWLLCFLSFQSSWASAPEEKHIIDGTFVQEQLRPYTFTFKNNIEPEDVKYLEEKCEAFSASKVITYPRKFFLLSIDGAVDPIAFCMVEGPRLWLNFNTQLTPTQLAFVESRSFEIGVRYIYVPMPNCNFQDLAFLNQKHSFKKLGYKVGGLNFYQDLETNSWNGFFYKHMVEAPVCELETKLIFQTSVDVTQTNSDYDDESLSDSDSDTVGFELMIQDEKQTNVGGLVAFLINKPQISYAYIYYLFIEEAHRGKKLATKLMEKAETYLLKNGCQWVELETRDHFAPWLYEKRGYKRIQESSNMYSYPNGTFGKHYRYRKQLSE